MNHLIVFAYVMILLITGAALLLSVLVKLRYPDDWKQLNYRFFLYLFLYQIVDFIFYYKGNVVFQPSVAAFVSFISAVLFVAYNYYVIRILNSLTGKNFRRRLLAGACMLYAMAWLVKSLWFLDEMYVETMQAGNYIASVVDGAVMLALMGYLVCSIYEGIRQIKARSGGQWLRIQTDQESEKEFLFADSYALLQCVLSLLYMIYVFLSSVWIEAGIYNLETWPVAMYFVEVFIYAGIGINGVLYLLRLLTRETPSEEKEDGHLISGDALIRIADKYQLSPREREVFFLLADGITNQDISDQLCISINTTKKHVNSIYRKLNINSRTKLLEICIHENDENRQK